MDFNFPSHVSALFIVESASFLYPSYTKGTEMQKRLHLPYSAKNGHYESIDNLYLLILQYSFVYLLFVDPANKGKPVSHS